MRQAAPAVPALLDELEKFYGRQEPCWPVDPYQFIVWWQCGYPASDAACSTGWEKLKSEVGTEPHKLLEAAPRKLAAALKPGGMVPELRALRLKEIAMRVKDGFSGDLPAALAGTLSAARKTLKNFPGMQIPEPIASCCLPDSRPSRRFPPTARRCWFVFFTAKNARTTA